MSEEKETILIKEDVIETLKHMIFGEQAFKRFTADERDALDYVITMLETDNDT